MGRGARTKGYFKNLSTGEIKAFMFNPNTIDVSREIGYVEHQGCGASYPKFQYTGGGVQEISFSLYLNGNASVIRSYVQFLEKLTPELNSNAKFKIPPTVLFSFGNDFTHECIFTRMKRTHTQFDEKLGTTELTFDIGLKVVA